jgi:hypothetical protein
MLTVIEVSSLKKSKYRVKMAVRAREPYLQIDSFFLPSFPSLLSPIINHHNQYHFIDSSPSDLYQRLLVFTAYHLQKCEYHVDP